jgi:ribonucleoside-diphosphate reductase alpha chain
MTTKMDWYTPLSEEFMGRGYFHNNDSIEDRIESIADLVGKTFNDNKIKNKVKDYIEKGYYVLPSPVWSNVGTGRGSGISCFNTHVSDSIKSIIKANAEVGMLCKIGGGTSGYFGELRPAGSSISTGGETHGAVHFMQMFDVTKNVISQGNVRRGEFAAYLDITHGDAKDFLRINGEGHKLQRFPFGICVNDKWLEEMKAGDMDKRELWAMVIDSRNRTGFPYIFFTDNVNNNTVDVYKDTKARINSSNMCTEILLPSTEEESFVCDLVGMNLVKFDEWKNTDAVRIAVYIADAVLTEFINKYEDLPFVERAITFAKRHRAIGIGASGYHSYLQSNMIPFESMQAKLVNTLIFKTIQEQCWAASREMASLFGKPEVLASDKYDRRHTTLTAVAPNTSSSFIMGQQSQSVEPYTSNYYIKKTAKVKHSVKNPYLKKLLEEKGQDTFEVWESILQNAGSVQHLSFLSEDEKLVFRTFMEISQMEIIIQASNRQKYVDQGQSLNLMIHPQTPTKDINVLLLKAHELGIKTLYYQLGQNAAQEFARDILSCESCAG